MVWARSHRVFKSKDRLNLTNLNCGTIKTPEWQVQFWCGYLSVACRILNPGGFLKVRLSWCSPWLTRYSAQNPVLKITPLASCVGYTEVFCSGFGGSVEVICSSNRTARLVQVLEMKNLEGVKWKKIIWVFWSVKHQLEISVSSALTGRCECPVLPHLSSRENFRCWHRTQKLEYFPIFPLWLTYKVT